MNKINLKFIIQNDLINQNHKCYSDLVSIINDESTITAANKILEELKKEVEELKKEVEKLNKKINDLNNLIKKDEKAKIRKKYIKDLD